MKMSRLRSIFSAGSIAPDLYPDGGIDGLSTLKIRFDPNYVHFYLPNFDLKGKERISPELGDIYDDEIPDLVVEY